MHNTADEKIPYPHFEKGDSLNELITMKLNKALRECFQQINLEVHMPLI